MKPFGHGAWQRLLRHYTEAQVAKVKPDKQDYAEPQAICLAKQSINRVKIQPAERETCIWGPYPK